MEFVFRQAEILCVFCILWNPWTVVRDTVLPIESRRCLLLHLALKNFAMNFTTSKSPNVYLPHPVYVWCPSARGRRSCTRGIVAFCPTSGTPSAPPSRSPGCSTARLCTSTAPRSSPSSPLQTTMTPFFQIFTNWMQYIFMLLTWLFFIWRCMLTYCWIHSRRISK